MDQSQVAKVFVTATVNVLATVARITPVAGKPFVKDDAAALGDVTGIVGVTGARRGSIAVTFTRSTALAVVKAMLDNDVRDALRDTRDAVGELTNMISGQARAILAEQGLTMEGATPDVIFGDGHRVSHRTTAPVMAIPFSTHAGRFTVEFCLE